MTNKELAAYFGVSPAAFSLIINNKPGISEATRQRILNGLDEMGYTHLTARHHSQQQRELQTAKSISFVIYKRTGEILDLHPFFLLLMEAIETRAKEYGYNVILKSIDMRSPGSSAVMELSESSCGAIIFATEMKNQDIAVFSELPIPIVALDNQFSWQNINAVSINNEMGTYQAIEYLVKMGHKKIGYLRSKTRIHSFDEREAGFRSALDYFGLPLPEEYVIHAGYTEEGSYKDIRAYLAGSPSLPEAFVTDDDTIASGAMRAFADYGIYIPRNISLIGFNDRPVCEFTLPPLTTINVARNSLAVEACDLLHQMIEENRNNETHRSCKIRIGTSLVIRNSVKDLR